MRNFKSGFVNRSNEWTPPRWLLVACVGVMIALVVFGAVGCAHTPAPSATPDIQRSTTALQDAQAKAQAIAKAATTQPVILSLAQGIQVDLTTAITANNAAAKTAQADHDSAVAFVKYKADHYNDWTGPKFVRVKHRIEFTLIAWVVIECVARFGFGSWLLMPLAIKLFGVCETFVIAAVGWLWSKSVGRLFKKKAATPATPPAPVAATPTK